MPRFGRFRDVAVRASINPETALSLKCCVLAALLLAASAVAAPAAAQRPGEVVSAVDRYLALREVAFSTRPEEAEVKATPGQEQVYGVIVEFQADGGLVTAVGFASGDASVYYSTGGGKIGGRREPLVAAAARSLVEKAQAQLSDLPNVQNYPTPTPGRVRVYALTTTGLRSAEEDRADIQDPTDRLASLFAGGRRIVSEFLAAGQ
jgi:hypothetical protein